MPPKRILKSAGSGIILGDACCFCQRPADDAVPAGLGSLIQCTSGNTALKYHEACAAYSMVIAMNHPRHGSIQEWRVNSEAKRGSNVICVLCRKPGATVKCSGKGCSRSYHFPCAREAAMKSNPNDRINEAVRPVFAGLGCGSSDPPGHPELACLDHAEETISQPLQEPAGLWFENYGGWNCQFPEIATAFLSNSGPLEEEEDMDVAAAGGAATATTAAGGLETLPSLNKNGKMRGQGEGSSDQTREDIMLVDHLASTTAVAPTAKPLAAAPAPTAAPTNSPKRTTFDILNHHWEVSACVQGPLPPLRHKEGRVLGVTLSAPVFEAYRRTITAFLIAAKRNSKLRHVVPLQSSSGSIGKNGLNEIAKSVQKTICSAAKAENMKKVKPELPEAAPCHPALEAFCISKDDPRAGLAAEPGALGVRVRANAETIKPYELLGIYGGLQLFYEDHTKMLDDAQLAKAIGLRCKQQLATKIESYTADEEMVQHLDTFEEAVPEAVYVERATGGWYKSLCSWLLTTAFLYGNMTCLINDPTLDPFRSATDRNPDCKKKTSRKNGGSGGDGNGGGGGGSSNLLSEPNCKMMSCLIRGWPFIILVSIAPINPGQELLYLYNGKEAHESMTVDGYWSTLREKFKLETDALNALDREEELLRKMEKDRLEKEEKDREIAALKAQLMMAKETLSSGQDLNSNERGTFTTGGGGSAVIGDARRNATAVGNNGSAAVGAGDAGAAGIPEHRSEIIIEDDDCGNGGFGGGGVCGGSGVTTTPNGELSVLNGSVSTEDINLANEAELEATGEGGIAIQLDKQQSLVDVVDRVGGGGIASTRKEIPISAGNFDAGGVKEMEVLPTEKAAAATPPTVAATEVIMTEEDGGVDGGISGGVGEATTTRGENKKSPPAAAATSLDGKKEVEKKQKTSKQSSRSRDRGRSRSRGRSRGRCRSRSRSPRFEERLDRKKGKRDSSRDGYNELGLDHKRQAYASSPGRGRGRSRGRGRDSGRDHFSASRDRRRRRSHSPYSPDDLRNATPHRSSRDDRDDDGDDLRNSHRERRIDSRSRLHSRRQSRSRSRSRDRRRDYITIKEIKSLPRKEYDRDHAARKKVPASVVLPRQGSKNQIGTTAAPRPLEARLPDPSSVTVKIPLSDPRFGPERSDSLSLPPRPPVAAPAHQHHHQPGHLQNMSFVIPASISDIPKVGAGRPPRSSSPRPVLVGDIHSPENVQVHQLQTQPSMSDATSGRWHQVVSPKKPPRAAAAAPPAVPSYYSGGNGVVHQAIHHSGGTAEVYDPSQAYHHHHQHQQYAVSAAAPLPWGYADTTSFPTVPGFYGEEGKPATKGWYEES